MRLLDRYLLRELGIPLTYCFSGFLVFWVAFDLFSELDHYQMLRLGLGDIVTLYALKLPEMLYTVMPIALLLALLYALTNHARHNEIVAIRAAGVSIWRLTIPYFAVGVLCSLALLFVNDLWLYDTAERAERLIRERQLALSPKGGNEWQSDLNFHNEHDRRLWTIGGYHPQAGVMTNVLVEWDLPEGAHRTIQAQRGIWTNDNWLLQGVVQFTYLSPSDVPPPLKTNEIIIAELTETPELLDREIQYRSLDRKKLGKRASLSLKQIRQFIALHPNLTGEDRFMLLTQWHGRLAAPWTCLVVVMIAIPFGIGSGRRNVFVGVASSVFICFAFFVISQFGLAIGTSGRVEPWLAAWLPNLLFGIGGLALMFKAR